ncbi:MAG: YjbQ family protein [Tatlockia sp.]|nr:YjbQ family protein [Tatlockia sp.]
MDNKIMQQIINWQTECILEPKTRGFHLIDEEIKQYLAAMPAIENGLIHFFLQHTSASLAISENTCADVAKDLETYFSKNIPDDNRLYRHTLEGVDDMPAHIKNVLLGVSLTIPLKNKTMALGQWQGLYLCEHRNQAPARRLIITAQGVS